MDNEFLEIVNKTDRIIKFSGILVFYPNEPVKVSGKNIEQVPAIDILIKRGDFEIVGGANELPKTAENPATHEAHETAQERAEMKRAHKTVRKDKKSKREAKTAEEVAKETKKDETAQAAEERPLGDSLNDPENLL